MRQYLIDFLKGNHMDSIDHLLFPFFMVILGLLAIYSLVSSGKSDKEESAEKKPTELHIHISGPVYGGPKGAAELSNQIARHLRASRSRI